MVASVGAIVVATRLNRWYIRTLENNLLNRGGGIDFFSAVFPAAGQNPFPFFSLDKNTRLR